MDLIDRQYAITHYQHVCRRMSCKECPFHIQVTNTLTDCELELFLHNLPSAQPETRWISCEKKLPEHDGRYLCTVGASYRNPREMYYAPQAWADKSDNATWRSIDGSYVFDWFVEAWMPLPEPYRKETEDADMREEATDV